MMPLLRAYLFVPLENRKNKGILLFQGWPGPCLPTHSFLTRPLRTLPRRGLSQAPAPLFTKRMPLGYAHFTGGARHPPRVHREGKLELTKASRSQDRGCGNSRRLLPGETRADRSGRYVRAGRRHPPAPWHCIPVHRVFGYIVICPLAPITALSPIPAATSGAGTGSPSRPSGVSCAPVGVRSVQSEKPCSPGHRPFVPS
jgi:hypothetical protein